MMSKKALLLSLGHNSSSIYTDGDTVIGYEQERLDRIKSSSAAPIGSLCEIEKHMNLYKVPMFVTHWFDKFDVLPHNKYSKDLTQFGMLHDSPVKSHDKTFTHHDAHAWSALSFYRHYIRTDKLKVDPENTFWKDPLTIIVADGFGNFQETLSIYEATCDGEYMKPVRRSYGFETSLGLMYQYATDFCGMKMNQDEYKFLGYESKAEYCLTPDQIMFLDGETSMQAGWFLVNFPKKTDIPEAVDDIIDFEKLKAVHIQWHVKFEILLSRLGISDRTSGFARVAIAFYIQGVIEKTLRGIIKHLGAKNVAVAGGIFYNVKLNNSILNSIPGVFCVVPLAGDQGASIGFYEQFIGHFNWDTLAIGNRNWLNNISAFKDYENVYAPETETELNDLLLEKIKYHEICNLVTSNLEYGPRALGNTSSLFLPTDEMAKANNTLNQRNEVMPFAPMIAEEAMDDVFDSSHKRVIGSDRFMIVTYDYIIDRDEYNAGVFHKYPLIEKYSGRPQVIYQHDKVLHKLLCDLRYSGFGKLLTNTSYNYHGDPIPFTLEDILNTHKKQMENYCLSGKTLPKINLILYNEKNKTDSK